MKYKIVPPSGEPSRHDGVLICVLSDSSPGRRSAAGRQLSKLRLDLDALARGEGFKGGESDDLSLTVVGEGEPRRVLLLGLGRSKEVDAARLRRRLQRAGAILRSRKMRRPLVCMPSGLPVERDRALEAIILGLHLGAGARTTYATSGKKDVGLPSLVQIQMGGRADRIPRSAVKSTTTLGDIILEARSWVTEPANKLGPADLARRAARLGRAHGVACEVWTLGRIRKERMHMLEQVGIGASRDPRFVKMSWRPRRKDVPHVVIVGKGIVFDTGGLSLKPVKGMPAMKNDMAGAAVAAAVVAAVASRKLPVRVTALLPIAENTPSSTAYRPGDVISGRLGKTVEIISTDAEGRLVMADAMTYGAEMKPDALIDVATLTGSCVVALGSFTAGLWSNRDGLAGDLLVAARQSGESMWRMPLAREIRPFLRSDVADLRNTQADPYGGAIAAALFLEEFAGETAWAHLDIAGPAFHDKRTDVGPRGATGYGITTLVRYLENLARGR
jgi:leucyl aminopeptidase